MQQLNQALQAGYAALQRGAFAEARRHLEALDHPQAVHLLGIVEKSDGNLDAAAELLERAAEMAPSDPDIANNRGQLARESGQLELAARELQRALELRAGFPQARKSLGRVLIDLERWQDALTVYLEFVEAAPNDVSARYGLGTAELNLGQAEAAEALFDALIGEGSDEPQIRFMRARARLELGKVDSALEDLQVSYRQVPGNFSLKTLASTYWMLEDTASFEELLAESSGNPDLAVTTAEILRQSGQPGKALAVLDDMRRSTELPAESWSVAATAHIDLNHPAEAETAARECLRATPEDRLIKGSLISSLLMQGKAEEAMPHIQAMRLAEPNGQHWIAYEATALRILGLPDYAHLVDLDRFVRAYTLPTPAGFDSLEAFNAAFLEALDRWHHYKTHPLDQSLRDGSQTPRDLTTIDDPVIRAYVAALDEPIRQYMADVGSGDDHPLTARNTGDYRITGSWSVRLHGGGRHVNHVHPEGWISSCYYIFVPEETRSGDDRAGWIKFAEPPFETRPPTPPEKWVRPAAGMLVLFPSFLWHGTHPIHDGSVRVTAPFDAVPA